MNDGDFVIFKEEQKHNQLLIMIGAFTMAVIVWYVSVDIFAKGESFVTTLISEFKLVIFLILFGIVTHIYLISAKQITEVRSKNLCIYTDPFQYGLKKYPFRDIESCEIRDLSLAHDKRIGGVHVGGTGHTMSGRRYRNNNGKMTNIPENEFIVKGNKIVEVEFKNGQKIKIGSQRPDELAAAISSGMSSLR
jgi:hypothetical protein